MAAEENGVVSGTQSTEYLAHPEGTRRGFSFSVNKLQFIVECTLVYNVACFFVYQFDYLIRRHAFRVTIFGGFELQLNSGTEEGNSKTMRDDIDTEMPEAKQNGTAAEVLENSTDAPVAEESLFYERKKFPNTKLVTIISL